MIAATLLLTLQSALSFKFASSKPKAIANTNVEASPRSIYKNRAPIPLALSTLEVQETQEQLFTPSSIFSPSRKAVIESPTSRTKKPESPMKGTSKIGDFFRQKNILITGGNGFLGEVLLETLIKRIPDVGKIYCLYNKEKGLDNEKIKWIQADLSKENFNLSNNDLLELKYNVEVIIHLGDDQHPNGIHTNKDIIENCDSILNVADFAMKCTNLQHTLLSSSYWSVMNIKGSNIIGEMFFQDHAGLNEYEAIKSGETIDKIHQWPNEYAYSMNLAERLIQQKYPKLGVTVARLTPTCRSYQFPSPGFFKEGNETPNLMKKFSFDGSMKIDNTMNHSMTNDLVPADICVNTLLANIVENAHGGQKVIHVSSSNRKTPKANDIKGIPVKNKSDMTLKDVASMKQSSRIRSLNPNVILSTNFIESEEDNSKKKVLLDYNSRSPLRWMSPEDKEYFPCDIEAVDWTVMSDIVAGSSESVHMSSLDKINVLK